jgi:YaiO family outer membrane protein
MVMAASAAEAARARAYGTGGLPDVEINLDVLNSNAPAAPVAAPAPVAQPAPVTAPAADEYPVSAPAAPAEVAGEPAVAAYEAPAAAPAAPASNGYIEVGGNVHTLSDDFGNWNGQYVKGEVQSDSRNRWSGELLSQREFGRRGFYGSVGNSHVIDEDWYTTISIGGGAPSDANFLPRYRVDAFLNRKWLERRQLVTTVGVGYYKAMETYNDKSLFLGTTYYFEAPWTVQLGYRFNNSSPGSVNSSSGFVAVTEGREKDHYVTARFGYGEEAYQLLGKSVVISDFDSYIASLEWRKWVSDDMGFKIGGEQYHNPNYDRNGVNFGVFKEF